MNIENYRDYCLSLPFVQESFPFDNKTLVFTVGEKIFSLSNIDLFESVNLKCDPEKALELREEYPNEIQPGYHMNKKHWNTVSSQLDDSLLKQLTQDSYRLVFKGLTKKVKESLD